MKIISKALKCVLFPCLLILASASFGQKLPNVQSGSLQAPSAVKIDGQSTEWGGVFQAYNHSTDLFYSVANNDKYLCLIIRATDMDIIKKIVRGGITISVNTKEKEILANCKAIQFPLTRLTDEGKLNSILAAIKEAKPGYQTDSLVTAYNTFLQSIAKDIKISTRNGIPDSVISIYNDEQILAFGLLANNLALPYEFKIPLTVLKVPYLKGNKIYYNIRLNGRYALSSPALRVCGPSRQPRLLMFR